MSLFKWCIGFWIFSISSSFDLHLSIYSPLSLPFFFPSILQPSSIDFFSSFSSFLLPINPPIPVSLVRRKVTEYGAVRVVLDCVDSCDQVLQENSLSLLLNLSLDDDKKVGLVADGVVRRVVSVLRVGSPGCKAIAATLLASLVVVEVNKATIGSYPDAISALVCVLREGNEREKKESVTAFYALCSFPDNRKRVVGYGSVPILVEAADSGLERAVKVLGLLVKCRGGREEMSKVSGFVEVLVNVLRNGSLRGIPYSFFILNCLCCCSTEIVDEVKREGVVEICFGLEDNESEKVRRNATNLVHTLLGNVQ